jgi:hypothetical protein
MWEVKSVVPSFGHPSETTSMLPISFFIAMFRWSKALRP